LDEFRRKKETVIFISDAHQSEDRELKIYPKHAMRDSTGARVIDELAPLPGEYQITKRCYSGVFSTPMADVLKRNYVTEAHLVGAYASVDVMETAAGLFYHGFSLVVHRKGLADAKLLDQSAALKRMQKIFNLKIV
jgi:nicotinamidase-related amidase